MFARAALVLVALLLTLAAAGCARGGYAERTGADRGPDSRGSADRVQGLDRSDPDDRIVAACAQLFGSLPSTGDRICEQSTPTVCRVAVTLKKLSSCDELCADHGTVCVGAWNNVTSAPCDPTGFSTCASKESFDNICSCTPPGAPPAMTCGDRFPKGFVCSESGSSCLVVASLAGQSCDDYCAAGGYACKAASLKSGEVLCVPVTQSTCPTIQSGTTICECVP